MDKIAIAKIKLYHLLINKPVEKLTETEIDIGYHLAKDKDIQFMFDMQNILDRRKETPVMKELKIETPYSVFMRTFGIWKIIVDTLSVICTLFAIYFFIKNNMNNCMFFLLSVVVLKLENMEIMTEKSFVERELYNEKD